MSDKTAKLFVSYRILERIQEFLVVELSREGEVSWDFTETIIGNILLVKQISYISILNDNQLNGDSRFTDALIF